MTESLKFGPEWLRVLSDPSDGGPAGVGGGGGPQPVVSANARYMLAEHRYGREEMLALFNNKSRVPEALHSFPLLLVEKWQPPLALVQMTDDETRMWQRGINSDIILRQTGKIGPAPSPRERGRGGGASVGGGGSMDRGRGRGRASINYYPRGLSYEEDASREPGGIPINSYSSRGRYERSQSGQDRTWGDRNGTETTEWNGSTSPRKDFLGRSAMDNWRSRGGIDEEGGGWKTSGHPNKWNRNSWRESGGDRETEGIEPESGRTIGRSWDAPGYILLRDPADDVMDKACNLPEWAMENPSKSGGSFDATGAFHGGMFSDDEDDRSGAIIKKNGRILRAGNTQEGLQSQQGTQSQLGSNNQQGLQGQQGLRGQVQDKKMEEDVTTSLKIDKDKPPPPLQRIRPLIVSGKVYVSNQDTEILAKKLKGELITNNSVPPPTLRTETNQQVPPPTSTDQISPRITEQRRPFQKIPPPPTNNNNNNINKQINSIKIEQELQATDAKGAVRERKLDDDMELMRKVADDLVTKLTSEEEQHPKVLTERWLYRDPQGDVQGPFTPSQMLGWFNCGYFTLQLEVRRDCDAAFSCLGDLAVVWGGIPFKDPLMLPPLKETVPHKADFFSNIVNTGENLAPGAPPKPSLEGPTEEPGYGPLYDHYQHMCNLQREYREKHPIDMVEVARNQPLWAKQAAGPQTEPQPLTQQISVQNMPSVHVRKPPTNDAVSAFINQVHQKTQQQTQQAQVYMGPKLITPETLKRLKKAMFDLSCEGDLSQQHSYDEIECPRNVESQSREILGYVPETKQRVFKEMHQMFAADSNIPPQVYMGPKLITPETLKRLKKTMFDLSGEGDLNQQHSYDEIECPRNVESQSREILGYVPETKQRVFKEMHQMFAADSNIPPQVDSVWGAVPVSVSQQQQQQQAAQQAVFRGHEAWSNTNMPSRGAPPPGQLPASLWDIHPKEMKTEQQVLEEQLQAEQERKKLDEEIRQAERRREMEELAHQALEVERRRKEEEKLRLEEEMMRRMREEELRKAEAERQRAEELQKLEQLRLEEERKRELARQQEELRKKQLQEEKLRRETELRLEMEHKAKEEEEKRRELDEKTKKRQEEAQRKQAKLQQQKAQAAQSLAELKQQEMLRHQESLLRQQEALRQIEETQLLHQQLKQQASQEGQLQHQKLKKQQVLQQQQQLLALQQQRATAKVAPWTQSANAAARSNSTSLAEIQKQEKEKREQEKEHLIAVADAAADLKRQGTPEALAELNYHRQVLNLKWAEKHDTPKIKSLAEIQAEEQRQLKARAKVEVYPPAASAASAGIWTSASHSLTWSQSRILNNSQPTNVWAAAAAAQNSTATTANAASIWGAATDTTAAGLWDDIPMPSPPKAAPTKANKGVKGGESQSASSAAPTKSKSSKSRAKKEEQQVMKLFEQKSTFTDEFTSWCVQTLTGLQSTVDIPTFVGFLKDIESPYEVNDYVRSYLGDGREAREFARSFLERRSKWRNSQKAAPAEDDMCKPAPAVNPLSNDFQEVKGKGKKPKKRLFRVDNDILGFSVTAAQDRINVGDRDYGEGM